MAEEKQSDLKIVKPWEEAQKEAHAGRVGGLRNLKEIEVDTDDGYRFIYLVKRPTKNVMMAIAESEQKNDITGIQKLMLGCVLEGDKDAYENDGAIYMQLMERLGELGVNAKSRIKKK